MASISVFREVMLYPPDHSSLGSSSLLSAEILLPNPNVRAASPGHLCASETLLSLMTRQLHNLLRKDRRTSIASSRVFEARGGSPTSPEEAPLCLERSIEQSALRLRLDRYHPRHPQ
jgi:hypothetical protein